MKDSNKVDSLVLPKIPCMNTTALWDWTITCPSTQVQKIKPQEKVDLLYLYIINIDIESGNFKFFLVVVL